MKLGLVLGGGGLVGMGYHAGVLKALDESGIDAGVADLIIGTSAGSVIGSYLASGWAASDFYEYGLGRHPRSSNDPEEHRQEVRDIFIPMWTSGGERIRRGIGSFFALASSRGLWRTGGRMPIGALRRAFPSGMYSIERSRERLGEDLTDEWPERDLFICAAELYTGKRVPFGAPGQPRPPLPEAVLASTAIPGVFPPVRLSGLQYVDGGVVSATSLDLATASGCDAILCIAPLGYRRENRFESRDPTTWSPMILRALFARALRREVLAARAVGTKVFVLRPWLSDLKEHGTNSMRHFDRIALIENAREGTTRHLEATADDEVLDAFRTATKEKGEPSWSQRSTASNR